MTTVGGSKIERARLDGSGREIFINTSISAPVSLTIDCQENVMYWCDKDLNKIERVNLTTHDRITLVSNVTDCVSLSVYEDRIYWVDV